MNRYYIESVQEIKGHRIVDRENNKFLVFAYNFEHAEIIRNLLNNNVEYVNSFKAAPILNEESQEYMNEGK